MCFYTSNNFRIPLLYAATFGRTASVVGNRSNIFDHSYFESCCLKSTDCCFTTGTGTFYENFNGFKAVLHCCFCCSFCCSLCCVRSGFSGTTESESACGSPRKSVAANIGDGNDSVIEGGLDMCCATFDIFLFTTATSNCFFSICFRHVLILPLISSC